MANVENLNFEIILKDDNFRKRVSEDMRLADELNTHLSNALDFNKKVKIDPLKRVTTETRKMTQEMDKFNKSAGKEVTKRFTQMNTQLINTSGLLRTISQLTGVAFSVVGIRRFLSSLIEVTGQFEVQKMALRNMLQDIDGADKIFEQLYNFSSRSTYRFSELAKYAKQLAAFNIDQNSLLDTTKMLGDVASGVGVSMDRIILAYGHVKSSGFLRGIQLRSFSQNGVPVLEELSKMLTEIEGKAVSLGDVFDKMMKREITFEMVEEAFRRMTSEGGKFYQMQEVLAKTLSGQINILKGKWENLMYALGESEEGVLKGIVGALTKIVSSTESFGKAIKTAIALIGGWRFAVLAAAVATDTMTLSQTRLVAVIDKAVRLAFKPATYAMLAQGAAVLAFTTYIAGAIIAIKQYTKASRQINQIHEVGIKEVNRYADALSEEKAELDRLYARLELAKEGTQDYNQAKSDLLKRFNPYIEQLRQEGKEVNNLVGIYDDLATKIEEANRQRFLESATEKMGEAYGNATATIADEFEKYIRRVGGLSIAQQEALRAYYKGSITKEAAQAAGVPDRAFTYGTPGGYSAFSMGFTPYQMGFKEAGDSIDALAAKYANAGKVLEETRKEVADAMNVIFGPEAPTNNRGRQEGVEYSLKDIDDEIKQIDRDLAKIRSKKDLGTADEAQIKSLEEEREEWTKLYKTLKGVDYDKQAKAGQTEADKVTKARIANIKSEVSLLEKYKDAREKLAPYFGSDTDNQLAKLFGDDKDYSTLDAQILELCDSLRKLGDDGVEAAEAIETRLGLDNASALVKAQKALQKWQNTLRKWEKDWGGGDLHGIEYDIDKVIRDYNNADEEISREFLESEKELIEAHRGNADAMQEEMDKLFRLLQLRKEANKVSAQEKLNDLADNYVKDKTKNLSLKDWGDKSIGQVRDLYRTLTELAAGEVVLDETTKARLAETGLKIEDFANLAKENFEQLAEEAQQELMKKLGDILKEIASDLESVAEAAGDLADATGNAGLAAFADAMTNMLPMVESTLGRLAQGDYIGAVVGWLAQVATGFFRAKQEAMQFEASIRAAQEESRRSGFSDMLSGGVDSVFGSNDAKKIDNAIAVMNKAKSAMGSRSQMGSFSVKRGFWDWFVGQGGLSKLRYMQFSLAELAQSVGRDLYDAYGNLNAETLKAILDTYDGLGQAEREWIEQAITDSEAYADAMEQLGDVMESVFGKIASDAASQIVDQWSEAGDAALDYADIIDDVARSYAKMITQSMLLDSVLTDDFKRQLQQRFSAGDTAGAMELILGGLQQMQAMAPEIAAALEPLRPYINTNGSGSDTLSTGIQKELVEQNSSLIASYMNAMRADLSVIRLMQTGGWSDIRFIREGVPSLVEYTAQIAASNYDIAQSTQSILSKLQSVITPSTTGGSAVRTTK